ncbi:bactofilin family protein [Cognatilysobacter tabacisoli]|jgi:cytoskeletal protein CcmA (bactofilin family)|uniref:bactofilin family protein n=1 Tax=Cognatilysobacter tabacisoli TaxID=2315424 RepID=UPI000E6B290A|nr:polymer-forming cytoskeletal protein [Lysobacter tabacisoli]
MAIFNQPATPKKDPAPMPPSPAQPESALKREPDPANEFSFAQSAAPAPVTAARTAPSAEPMAKESLIASDLTIEGKIQGAGHIRIAGKFKGDVHVDGDLTVEVGAKVNGGVRARKVVVAGELEGNVESAQRVELLESGVIVGDVKAGSVVVASGARMRGQVEFGWEDKDGGKKPGAKTENGAGA